MLVMMPFFLLAMYEKHGQPLEKIVGNILKVAVIRPKPVSYTHLTSQTAQLSMRGTKILRFY